MWKRRTLIRRMKCNGKNCSYDFCNRKQMWRVPGFLVHFLHGEHWNPGGVNRKDVEPVLLLWTSSHGAASILLWSKGGNHRIKASLQIASLCFRKPYLRHDIEFLLFVVTGGGLSFILTCKTSFFKTWERGWLFRRRDDYLNVCF